MKVRDDPAVRARRASTMMVALPLAAALACADPPTQTAAKTDPRSATTATAPSTPSSGEPAPTPSESAPGPAEVAAAIAQIEATAPALEPGSPAVDASALPPEDATLDAPADPLAPLLPEGPEPGSPEADAELQDLLDESTLTQDEFDRAFRGGAGPNVDGDRLVFGPNERTRERPKITITTEADDLRALARASMAELEACYVMALSKTPSAAGSVTLVLRYGAKGEVEDASAAPGSPLGASLDRCLASVAEGWTLNPSARGEARITLELATG